MRVIDEFMCEALPLSAHRGAPAGMLLSAIDVVVELDEDKVLALVRRARLNRSHRAVDGPISVRVKARRDRPAAAPVGRQPFADDVEDRT